MVSETTATGRDSDKFMLRLPDGMRDRLKEEAKSNNRTLNAEIVKRLEESLAIAAATTQTGNIKHSELVLLAGKLNDLQGQRNTLAVLLHAAKTNNGSKGEIATLTREIATLDGHIATTLAAMKSQVN